MGCAAGDVSDCECRGQCALCLCTFWGARRKSCNAPDRNQVQEPWDTSRATLPVLVKQLNRHHDWHNTSWSLTTARFSYRSVQPHCRPQPVASAYEPNCSFENSCLPCFLMELGGASHPGQLQPAPATPCSFSLSQAEALPAWLLGGDANHLGALEEGTLSFNGVSRLPSESAFSAIHQQPRACLDCRSICIVRVTASRWRPTGTLKTGQKVHAQKKPKLECPAPSGGAGASAKPTFMSNQYRLAHKGTREAGAGEAGYPATAFAGLSWRAWWAPCSAPPWASGAAPHQGRRPP